MYHTYTLMYVNAYKNTFTVRLYCSVIHKNVVLSCVIIKAEVILVRMRHLFVSKELSVLTFALFLTGRMATTKPDQSSSIVPSWVLWRGWLPSLQRTMLANGGTFFFLNVNIDLTPWIWFRDRGTFNFSPAFLLFSEMKTNAYCTIFKKTLSSFLRQAAVALSPSGDVSSCQPLLWGIRQEGKLSSLQYNCPIKSLTVNCVYTWILAIFELYFVFQVCKQFTEAGFMADADLDSGCLLNKKIRNAQLAQYNFILGEILFLTHIRMNVFSVL